MDQPSRQDRQRARQAAQRQLAQSAAAVVGVDAGKHNHCLVVRPRGGVDSKPFMFPTTRAGFDAAAARVLELASAGPDQVLVGIEFAGVYGFTLAHYLAARGFPIVSLASAIGRNPSAAAAGANRNVLGHNPYGSEYDTRSRRAHPITPAWTRGPG